MEIQNRSRYSSEFFFADKTTLVSYISKPQKLVILLSTLYHEYDILLATEKFKPHIISYYNTTKSGVDVLNTILRKYLSLLSLFIRFIDVITQNAFILW